MAPRLDWYWRDAEAVRPALILETKTPSRRPALRIEAAGPFRFRWTAHERPFLWMTVEDGLHGWLWTNAQFLRGASPPSVLPPWHADELRGVNDEPLSEAWGRHWLRKTAEHLTASPVSPLHPPRWRLALVSEAKEPAEYPCIPGHWDEDQPALPSRLVEALTIRDCWDEEWSELEEGGVIGLRSITEADEGRVKMWRKHLRDGTCPPILLLYVAAARKYLLLDGHARLAAAALESRMPPLLGLWSEQVVTPEPVPDPHSLENASIMIEVSRASPAAIAAANSYLRGQYPGSRPLVRTRAWPVDGGLAEWEQSVRQRLSELAGEVDEDLVHALLRPRSLGNG